MKGMKKKERDGKRREHAWPENQRSRNKEIERGEKVHGLWT